MSIIILNWLGKKKLTGGVNQCHSRDNWSRIRLKLEFLTLHCKIDVDPETLSGIPGIVEVNGDFLKASK